MKREWTPESIEQWQTFYNDASRVVVYGVSSNFSIEDIPHLPKYKDLKPAQCQSKIPNLATRQTSLLLLILIPFCTMVSGVFLMNE